LWNVGTALRYIILPVNTLRHSDVVVNYCTFDWRQFLLKHWSRTRKLTAAFPSKTWTLDYHIWKISITGSVERRQSRGTNYEHKRNVELFQELVLSSKVSWVHIDQCVKSLEKPAYRRRLHMTLWRQIWSSSALKSRVQALLKSNKHSRQICYIILFYSILQSRDYGDVSAGAQQGRLAINRHICSQ